MSWLTDYLGPNPTVDELIPQVGAILVGRRTFSGDDPYKGQPGEGEAFGGGWDGPQFVLTHRPPADPLPGVTFVTSLDSAVDEAAAAAGDKYVNVLGADVAAQCLRAGVLDEVLVSVTAGAARRGHPAVRASGRRHRQASAAARNPDAEWDEPVVPRHRAARASA